MSDPDPHKVADDLRTLPGLLDHAEAWTDEQAAAVMASHLGGDMVAMLRDAGTRLHKLAARFAFI